MDSSPACERTIELPVLHSTNEPVPYVHFVEPGEKHAWPNMRRLLVTGDARDRQRQAEERGRVGVPDHAVRRHHLGQRVRRHAEKLAQLGRPLPRLDVEQQRAGRVGRVA